MNWAWTLNPIALAEPGESGTGILWFSGWPELIAVVLLGAGFIILVGTLGAMWKNRWRDPMRDVASSRLDRPSSLELDFADAPVEPMGVVYSRSLTGEAKTESEPARTDRDAPTHATRASTAQSQPGFMTGSERTDRAARPHFLAASPVVNTTATSTSGVSSGSSSRKAAPPPTVDEAQRLLELMNQAEDQAARLNSHFDEREAALRSLIAEADGKLAQLRAAEQAGAMQARRSESAPTLSPQAFDHAATPLRSPVVTTVTRQSAPAMLATAAALHSGPTIARAEGRLSPGTPGRTRVDADVPPVTPITPTLIATDPAGPDPLTGEIYRLADQGMPHVEIARRLNQHVGKVELILALRPG